MILGIFMGVNITFVLGLFQRLLHVVVMLLGLLTAQQVIAADIDLGSGDLINTTSFNTGLNWIGGAAPTGGNDYFTAGFTLRTPNNTGSITFLGDLLTVNGGSLLLKPGSTGTPEITIPNLRLSNGSVNFGTGNRDARLSGNLELMPGTGTLNASSNNDNRTFFVNSDISGVGNLRLTADDGGAIFLIGGATLTVSNSIIMSNTAKNSTLSHGGAIFMNSATAQIFNSSFISNTASGDGGAIRSQSTNDTLIIVNSTFAHNKIPSGLYLLSKILSPIEPTT